ncbi:MAG: universal stress protein [Acidobacteria bacterium]|uniref:Universal stress protein n=1 Tax=Candidatus Polarisedimenticola svalbardensis TaxID=2886004 RepID=A0A8J6XZZ4_9BACT|nr:universal stress protein [Candidatus Polarisedimenticola svalbardensis]
MNILIAVDFSEVSRKALDVVRTLPRAENAKVFVIHVAEPDPEFVGWDTGPEVVREQVAAEFHRERQQVEAMADDLRKSGIEAAGLVVQGPTVATILDEVQRRDAGLLVVGSHGHGAAYDLTVGSISTGVIRKSVVPVLVVPNR